MSRVDLQKSKKNRVKVLNLYIDPFDWDQALSVVDEYCQSGDRPHSIFAVNPEKSYQVFKDPLLRNAYKTAGLLIPDGIGIVIASRIMHGLRLSRISGIELMGRICNLSAHKGYKIFIYGGKEAVNKTSVQQLLTLYPGLNIVGRSNGYLKDAEMTQLIQKINESQAEILFLALGSPKQEKWFMKFKDQLNHVRVVQGIGGTLDVITGNTLRAPDAWQKLGLEWLYRLISEPKRIRRQWIYPIFIMMVLISWLKESSSHKQQY